MMNIHFLKYQPTAQSKNILLRHLTILFLLLINRSHCTDQLLTTYEYETPDHMFQKAVKVSKKIDAVIAMLTKEETEKKAKEQQVKKLIEKFLLSPNISLLILNDEKKLLFKTVIFKQQYGVKVFRELAPYLSKKHLTTSQFLLATFITKISAANDILLNIFLDVKKGLPFMLIKDADQDTIFIFKSTINTLL